LNIAATGKQHDQRSSSRSNSRRDYHSRYGPVPPETYPTPEVSTQLQVALDGGDPEAIAELIAEIEQLVARFDS